MRDDLVETDLKIHVYTVCWNEEAMLPHFLRHYAFADRIVVYDNGSTDRSRKLIQACGHAELRSYDSGGTIDDKRYLEIKNTAWKESRGKADLVIVCDMDEFLYHPRLGKVFQHMKASGNTLLKPLGYEMVGDRVPAPDEDLLTCISNGMRSYVYDKCIVFDPNAIEEIRYGLGCHTCRPEGQINYLRLPDVCLLHYKHLSFEYVVKRYEIYSQRLSGFNKQRGIGAHYKRKGDEIKQMFERLNVQKTRVITEMHESRMKWTAPQVPVDLDERLRRGLTELNKRRFGTALADLDVVANWRGNGWRATAGIAVIMAHADRPYDSFYCLLQAAALIGEPVRGWLILAKFYRRLGFGRLARQCQRKYHSTVQPTPLIPETIIEDESFRLRNIYRVKQGKCDPGERYIVCADINDLYSGLGCCLFVLGPCWKYALKTGRTLIIDWRGNPYTRINPEKNLFSLLFEQPDPSEIGVTCIVDDSINYLQLPQPILGPAEVIPQESGAVDKLPVGGFDIKIMRQIVANCVDVDFPTVMPSLRTTFFLASAFGPMRLHGASVLSFREAQHLYQSLKLRPQWAAMVSEFYQAHMADQPVIGVHVRHGNGEGKFRDHFQPREIQNDEEFIKSLVDKIRRYAATRFSEDYTVFLCTDSDDVVRSMESFFPSLVSRRIWRPAPGEGIDFDQAYKRADGGLGAAVDALVDMQLLAKCDVVLMTRWTAFASHVPYIMEKPGAVFLDHTKTARI